MYINEIFKIEFPFIQGGMANIATGSFAAKVSNAGALGLIGSGAMNSDRLAEEIRIAEKETEKPFGVNLMLMNPDIEKMAQTVVDMGVKIVTTGAGNPGKYMDMWKKAGIFVMPVVAGATLAVRLESQGADAVIAEGSESGGHIGDLTTMAIVPQVREKVKIPVIAAGGIGSGSQLLAALALGASGVQMGTALLVSEECPIHENYKQAILEAKDNSTTVTGRTAGVPVRIIKNQMTREYLKMEKAGASIEELERFTVGSLRRAVFEGDVKRGSLMAGQISGQLKEIKPLRAIFEELYADYKIRLSEMKEEL